MFTDTESGSVDETGWSSIITNDKGSSPADWSAVICLGEFPSSYDFVNKKNGSTWAYYASNNGNFDGFGKIEVEAGGSDYTGYGVQTDDEYLCAPFAPDDTKTLTLYVVVKNEQLSLRVRMTIDGDDDVFKLNSVCAVNTITMIYDVSDLAEKFNLVNAEAATYSSVGSRSGNGGFIETDLKPRKIIVGSH